MTVYGLWWGGSSYSYPEMEDLESFKSINEAKLTLRDRYDSNGIRRVRFNYVDKEEDVTLVPAVDQLTTSIMLCGRDGGDPYLEIVFGPRGGIKINRC